MPRLALYAVFTLSGISALFYQLIWQRMLLSLFGSNIESVTMVVSAFMLGLGLGSLFGGYISRSERLPLLIVFGVIEMGIGVYGLFSPQIFHAIGAQASDIGMLATGGLSFGLIIIPTLLMGATLPLLVAHFVKSIGDVGYSVAMLYFVNTLGAGIGAWVAAFFALGWLGLSGSVVLAACLNFAAGSLILYYGLRKSSPQPVPAS